MKKIIRTYKTILHGQEVLVKVYEPALEKDDEVEADVIEPEDEEEESDHEIKPIDDILREIHRYVKED